MDSDLVGFLTAINVRHQPQTSPIWFMRDGDDIVVYNKSDAARLRSIGSNSKVAFNLRADQRGQSGVTLEANASIDEALPPAKDFPGYVNKYGREIERLGWTPDSFSTDYSVGIRLVVTRLRAWGVDKLSV